MKHDDKFNLIINLFFVAREKYIWQQPCKNVSAIYQTKIIHQNIKSKHE